MIWEDLIEQNPKSHILIEREKLKKIYKKFIKEIWKFRVNYTNFDSLFRASKTQYKGELIIWVHSLKKENKYLMSKGNQLMWSQIKSCIRKLHFSSSPEFISSPEFTRIHDLTFFDHVLYCSIQIVWHNRYINKQWILT